VSEVQGEGNVTVYNDVCLRYRCREMLLYKMMCVFVIEGEGIISIYIDVCLRYRVRDMLLYTMMCALGTGVGKCYFIK